MKINLIIPNSKNFEIYGQEDIAELKESIKIHGLLNPIVINQNNIILSGHRRYMACQELGIEDVEVLVKQFENEWEELEYLLLQNLYRQKNMEQKAREYSAIKLIEAEKAKLRQIRKPENFVPENSPEQRKGEAREKAAEHFEESYYVLERSEKVIKEADSKPEPQKKFLLNVLNNVSAHAAEIAVKENLAERLTPEAQKAVVSKEIKPSEALELAKIEPKKQGIILPKIQAGSSVKQAITEIKREERQEKIQEQITEPNKSKSIDIFTTTNKYRVIYADPCWSYSDKCEGGGVQSRGAEGVYPTMSIKQISELPVNSISEDNAVLFLWVTSPLLEECFQVIKSWGFKYKTSFVWDKVKHNMGHYNSVRHELLLICTKGSCTPDNVKLFDSVQTIERTEHSAKPNEFREIIDTLYTYGKKIELFSRFVVDGWDCWGNMV